MRRIEALLDFLMGCYFAIWREEEDEKEVAKSFVLLLASGTVHG